MCQLQGKSSIRYLNSTSSPILWEIKSCEVAPGRNIVIWLFPFIKQKRKAKEKKIIINKWKMKEQVTYVLGQNGFRNIEWKIFLKEYSGYF